MPRDCCLRVRAESMDYQPRRVERAPKNERPVRSVPETTKRHGDREIGRDPSFAPARTPQRNEKIVAQPGLEGDVPASPEVPWVGGEIRGIEILRQAVPEEKRRADGDVAVTREITIDLRCIPIDGQQSLEPRMGTDGLEYRVDQSAGD